MLDKCQYYAESVGLRVHITMEGTRYSRGKNWGGDGGGGFRQPEITFYQAGSGNPRATIKPVQKSEN